jgi:hypothetical protein
MKSQKTQALEPMAQKHEASKIESTNNSESHAYFIEHLMCVTEKPPRTPNEKSENSSLGTHGSKAWLKNKADFHL